LVRSHRFSSLVAIGLGALLIWAVMHSGVNLGQTLSLLRRTNPVDYLAAIAVFYFSSVVRAGRWKLLLRNAGERAGLATAWRILMVGWFMNGIFPAKPGDVYRAHLLGRSSRTPAAKVLGTIATERMLDFVILLLLIDGLGLLLFHTRMPGFFVVALAGTGAVVAIPALGLALARVLPGRHGLRLPSRLQPLAARFKTGLLGSVANVPLLLSLTVFLWLMEGVRIYLVVKALPVPLLSWTQLTLTALTGSMLTAVPGLPGGLSLVEGGMVTVLAYFGLTVSAALSVALLDRLINYWSVLVMSAAVIGLVAAARLVAPAVGLTGPAMPSLATLRAPSGLEPAA
jgi:uncharacterized membrane protein YbhN (UPF0104 family)